MQTKTIIDRGDKKAPAPQTNVRAPIEARDTLLRIGGLLRGDPDFLPKLQAFLDGYEGITAEPTLPERMDALERRLAAITAKDAAAKTDWIARARRRAVMAILGVNAKEGGA